MENETKQFNYWQLMPAEQINPEIAKLPKAEIWNLKASPSKKLQKQGLYGDGVLEDVAKYNIVRVNDNGKINYINPNVDYNAVQHEKAMRPIIDALTVSGVKDFRFCLTHTYKEASLWLFVGAEGYDGVSVGFEVLNSFCGHKKLNYGVKLDSFKRHIEIVGYRQVCSNGAKIRVPLEEAEIVKPEVVTKIKELASMNFSFKHTSSVMEKIEQVKYISEAVALLRQPIENMIKKAEKVKLDKEKLSELIKLHVGKRYKARVLDAQANENNDVWGLFNAITYVASHDKDLEASSRETLLNKANDLLLATVKGR